MPPTGTEELKSTASMVVHIVYTKGLQYLFLYKVIMKTILFFQELQEERLNYFHPTDNQHLSRVVVNILEMTVRNIIYKNQFINF